MSRSTLWFGLAMVTFCAAFTGCSSTPPNYYLLNTMEAPVPTIAETPISRETVAIGLEPIELPSYLDQTRLVRRTSPNTLDIQNSQQWGEPLNDGVQRVLAVNLNRLLPNVRMRQFPWPRGVRNDYRLTVEISEFDVDGEGSVALVGSWLLKNATTGETAAQQGYSFYLSSRGSTHAEVAATMSAALAELAQGIARAIDPLDED